MAKKTYLNRLQEATYKLSLWKMICISQSFFSVGAALLILVLFFFAFKGLKNERIILIPGLQNKIEIPANAFVSDFFIKGISSRIVNLLENWNYESLEENHQELYNFYLTKELENQISSNVLSTNRYEFVREKKMVSFFKIDFEHSKFEWCEKINNLCALVKGTRTVFINNNEVFSKKNVFYFLIGDGIYPTNEHPFAVKISRLIMDDSGSADAGKKMEDHFYMAKEGSL